jgi:hypothetical protein
MARVTQRKPGRPPTGKPAPVRATVGLSSEIYRTSEALAEQKKTSAAWMLRDAEEKYIEAQSVFLERRAS